MSMWFACPAYVQESGDEIGKASEGVSGRTKVNLAADKRRVGMETGS